MYACAQITAGYINVVTSSSCADVIKRMWQWCFRFRSRDLVLLSAASSPAGLFSPALLQRPRSAYARTQCYFARFSRKIAHFGRLFCENFCGNSPIETHRVLDSCTSSCTPGTWPASERYRTMRHLADKRKSTEQ